MALLLIAVQYGNELQLHHQTMQNTSFYYCSSILTKNTQKLCCTIWFGFLSACFIGWQAVNPSFTRNSAIVYLLNSLSIIILLMHKKAKIHFHFFVFSWATRSLGKIWHFSAFWIGDQRKKKGSAGGTGVPTISWYKYTFFYGLLLKIVYNFFFICVHTRFQTRRSTHTTYLHAYQLLHMQVIVLVLLFVSTCILFLPA